MAVRGSGIVHIDDLVGLLGVNSAEIKVLFESYARQNFSISGGMFYFTRDRSYIHYEGLSVKLDSSLVASIDRKEIALLAKEARRKEIYEVSVTKASKDNYSFMISSSPLE